MRTFGLRFTQPTMMPPTSLKWHQLIVAYGAPVAVSGESTSWLIPPGAGFWIPAGMGCKVLNKTEMSLQMLYLPAGDQIPVRFGRTVIAISPLLRELVRKIVMIGALLHGEARHEHLAALVWDELGDAEPISTALPLPASAPTKTLVECMQRQSFRFNGLESAIKATGYSRRTIERLILSETQLSLGVWLRKRRLLHAMELLLSGDSVTNVAFELGYNEASAFVAAFKREFGKPPSTYLRSAVLSQ